MNKQQILDEIKRIAAANDGKPPGEKLFHSETGLREHEWRGKYWAKWTDAVREAGYEPNKWVEATQENLLLEKYILLIRELGRLPSNAEMKLRRHQDPSFPSMSPFKRLGKATLQAKAKDYCSTHIDYDDVLSLLDNVSLSKKVALQSLSRESEKDDGFVYLMKSGRFYKIGRSVAVGQRERQLKIQLPNKAETVHSIRTDDPVGIETYWHKRFASKRKNGEWFELDRAEIGAFRRRKFM